MINLQSWLLFSFTALVMAITPGQNMMYLISRSISQGRVAGIISLGGIVLGFMTYMIATAFGLTALLLATPYAYKTIKIAGIIYLIWLTYKIIGKKSVGFSQQYVLKESPQNLLKNGFVTNILNPGIAVFYVAIFPQFIKPEKGCLFFQSMFFGITQIAISVFINLLIILISAKIYSILAMKNSWCKIQKWMMGVVMCGVIITAIF